MQPVIHPLPREQPLIQSRRATVDRTRRLHVGTLNIFSVEPPAPPAVSTQQKNRRHAHHSVESQETREFGYAHLRRVKPVQHPETPRGIHQVPHAAGKLQNIQVVGITDAYKNPSNMPTPRGGVRCTSRSNSSSMREILAYNDASSCNTLNGPPKSRHPSRVLNYSSQERFCQAVRDHAQHRRGGVTGFYVNLARNRVGGGNSNAAHNNPAIPLREWHLEDPPVTHTLSLGSCWEQLQSLTGINITLIQLAELLWDMDDLTLMMGGSVDEERLRELTVSYRDFSVAFGDNSMNNKLAVMKI
ncbi:hypothetical protein LSM04_003050 [Trypanosoma melophagium]|uniref:uncharacterized protein n=1 Tax=Trypanosoma melophagium TaxID=715481 RepID=UPI00351A08A1|nr:hypothetical protein LSM04_003050 [Trypanosoma melophagium]